MGRVTERRAVTRVESGRITSRPDTLAVEEPLEIRIDGRATTVTMRTPGHDLELALGFLLTEGVVAKPTDVVGAINCADNVVDVTLRTPLADDSPLRNFTTSSACGVCGKESIDAVRTSSPYDVATDPLEVTAELVTRLPAQLREAQRVFDRTGGLHAAALFDAEGTLLCLREDVGRHNAVDKVVGWAVQEQRLPLCGTVLQVSGRASFELVQKALMAGIPVLSAVSAPSSLAVQLAADSGLTLIGFVRGDAFNIYAGAHRLTGQ